MEEGAEREEEDGGGEGLLLLLLLREGTACPSPTEIVTWRSFLPVPLALVSPPAAAVA